MSGKQNAAEEREQQSFTGEREGEYLVSLLRSSLRGEPPMPAPNGLNWELLYALAERQLIAAAVWRALKRADGCPAEIAARFRVAADGALRKELLFDGARAEIFAAFDEQKIDYMPLKGVFIKELYPAKGMRQFADNDILYRESDRAAVDKIMRSLGYESEGLESVHDVYMKPPVYNFEMHRALFEERFAFSGWFEQVWDRAVKDEGDNCAWHMTDEDFYVYVTAHFAKHYEEGGAGLRSFADMYLMRRKLSLNGDKVRDVLRSVGLEEFERGAAEIADSLFGEETRFVDRRTMRYIFSSGAYGTTDHAVRNVFEREGKLRGALHLAFPPLIRMKTLYPVLKKAPVLLPVMWVVRLVTILCGKKRKKAAIALENFLQKDKKENEEQDEGK